MRHIFLVKWFWQRSSLCAPGRWMVKDNVHVGGEAWFCVWHPPSTIHVQNWWVLHWYEQLEVYVVAERDTYSSLTFMFHTVSLNDSISVCST